MSLRAGRVGVAPDEVDEQGHIKNGGGGDSYTKAQTDALLLTKADKSTLVANSKEFTFAYDESSQKYGYKAGADGEFVPFDGAGGGQGLVLDNLITTGLTFSGCTYVKGGYQIVNGILYIDITVIRTDSNSYVRGFPQVTNPKAKGCIFFNTVANVDQLDDFITSGDSSDCRSVELNGDSNLYIYSSDPHSYRFVIVGDKVVQNSKKRAAKTKTVKK